MYLGSFLVIENSVWIIGADRIEDTLSEVKNAVVEKFEYYWKVKQVKKNEQLAYDKNLVVKNKRLLENYCDLCRDRLVQITSGCSSCVFRPVEDFAEMDILSLVEAIKSKGFYEVDFDIFKHEVEQKKMSS